MIHMGLLNVIRRMALREKLPIRESARRTGLSQNTIKKYLRAGTIEPKFNVPAGEVPGRGVAFGGHRVSR